MFALDDIQSHVDEGPCLTAIREDHTVIIDDAESKHRWPTVMRPRLWLHRAPATAAAQP